MPLAPIGELIEVKPRLDAAFRLRSAVENPERTAADCVFTPSIKEHARAMPDNLRGGRYWALSERQNAAGDGVKAEIRLG